MINYIVRRLLLMIPTLIGITFLVFMLIALSPGGIGASDTGNEEGNEGSIAEAAKQAYLEDRYGLGDNVFLQYLRWLRGVSPVNFGEQGMTDPTGRVVWSPKRLREPILLGDWYGAGAEVAEQRSGTAPEFLDENGVELTGEALDEAKERRYRRAEDRYARVRAEFVGKRTAFERAAAQYVVDRREVAEDAAASKRREAAALRRSGDAAAADTLEGEARELDREARAWDGRVTAREEPREARLRRVTPDVETELGAAAVTAGVEALIAFNEAVEARNELADAYAARPFPSAGLGVDGFVHVAVPELGFSYARSRPVIDLIFEHLPRTLLLNALAVPVIYLIAVPSGMLMAVRRGSFIDTAGGAFFVALWSIPVVWAGVLCVGFLARDEYLGWFPSGGLSSLAANDMLFWPYRDATGAWHGGWVVDRLWHVVLPVACLVYTGFAVISKQTRAAMLDNFNADYVRTAKAKGVAPGDVVFRHVFRNSLLPLITLFASIFPAMLAGSVVVERIFSIPGMGSLIIEAIALRDRELLLANTLMIGVVNLLALLLADILYALADPRISYE